MNKLKKLLVEKLVFNITVGESGDRLTRAAKVLEQLTEQQPVFSSESDVLHLPWVFHAVSLTA